MQARGGLSPWCRACDRGKGQRVRGVDVLSFLMPIEGDESHSKQTAPMKPYLTSVDTIEALTGLKFLTLLQDDVEEDAGGGRSCGSESTCLFELRFR